MSNKPIFVATHPRACSTAFERVFMTRPDILHCVHEPFGDAFYYGPERLSERFTDDEATRLKSGFANTTYKDIIDGLMKDMDENKGKRLFIKDIIHYLFAPDGKHTEIAPSLRNYDTNQSNGTTNTTTNGTNGTGPRTTTPNPTVLPIPLLTKFHFTFLIRHPRRAIPSYYRCTVPPLDAVTGFYNFLPSEAGYDELRRMFDFLRDTGIIGGDSGVKVTVLDADDMLDHPQEMIRRYCEDVGIDYHERMLRWGGEEDGDGQKRAEGAFEKWKGFHEDALGSSGLKARVGGAKILTEEEEDEQWRNKFGDEAQKVIRECVNANIPDYEYLKQFALKL